MSGPAISNYTGSTTTYDMVAAEIEKRWGSDEIERYDAERNCLPFSKWLQLGYCVRKNERAIRSVTFIEKKDAEGKVVKKYRRIVCLFYYLQVKPLKS